MNKIFKVIYSKTRHCYVVVSELAKSHCKSTTGSTLGGGHRTGRKLTAMVLTALMGFTFGIAIPSTSWALNGEDNKTPGKNAQVVGGKENTARGTDATIVGGSMNNTGTYGTLVAGGNSNVAASLVGDGNYRHDGDNSYYDECSTVVGGFQNTALGADSTLVGGSNGVVQGIQSTGIAGGSTGNLAFYALAMGNGSVVTNEGVQRTVKIAPNGSKRPEYTNISTALGYQATANQPGTISFGHDKGDVSGYTVKWVEEQPDALGVYHHTNADGTHYEYDVPPVITTNYYDSSYYNRLVKIADGINSHDAVTMEQVTTADNTKANVAADNIGSKLQVVKKDGSGNTITDSKTGLPVMTAASDTEKTANESAWGQALGTGAIAKDNDQLVTGNTVYTAMQGKANVAMDNITDNGKTVIRNLAKEAVKVVDGEHTYVTSNPDTNATAYAVNIKTGQVKSGDGDLVTGGTVYDAIQNAKLSGGSGQTVDISGKADVSAGNVGQNFTNYTDAAKTDDEKKAERIANENDWGQALGTGKIANSDATVADADTNGSKQLVTGNTVYKEVRPASDGTYIKTANTTAQNLTNLDKQVGRAVQYDSSNDVVDNTKITLAGKEGTTISNVKAGTAPTDAVNVKQLTDKISDVTYTAGNGIDLTNKKISAKAGTGIKVDTNGISVKLGNHLSATGSDGAIDVKDDGSVVENNTDLVTGGTVYSALKQQKTDLSNSLSVNAGWGIDIDKTNGNTISLKHNLGTGYNDDNEAKGMIIGGFVEDRDATKQYGATDANSVILGAGKGLASGKSSVVVGGLDNVAAGASSVVAGGDNNDAIGNQSSVFGGRDNTAAGIASTAGGGIMNAAIGQQSAVLGGSNNYVLGANATAIGGLGRDYDNGKVVYDSAVRGSSSVGIAGGSTGADATGALAAGHQAVVTTANGTAIGYQATTDEANTIAFGHDVGDVSGYTINWKSRTDGKTNADGTTNDYTQAPESVTENTYKEAAYNRLVKVAEGKDDHDVVVMKQLKDYTKTDASNIGANLKSNDGTTAASTDDITKNENAWGTAIGTGKVAKDNGQLVTGKTVYEYNKPVVAEGQKLNYISDADTTGQNLTALDTQVKTNADNISTNTTNISTNTENITKLTNLSNITEEGQKVIKDLSKDAVKVAAGDRVKVDESVDNSGNKTYTVSAKNDGKVEKGNTDLVSGGTVKDAIDSAISGSNTETDTKLAGKANVDASNIGANLKGADGTSAAAADAIKANEDAWGTAIGTGSVAKDNGQLVTGGKVYDALHGGMDDIVIGHDGKDGNAGSIGLVGPKGQDGKDGFTTTIIKTETGAAGVDGKDGKDGITRIVYGDKDNSTDKHTVATLDDGMKYAGDTGNAANVKLNHQLKLSGTTFNKNDKKYDEKNWTSDNIAVVSSAAGEDGNATMYLKLNKNLNLTDKGSVRFGDRDSSTTLDASGLTIKTTVTEDGKTKTVNGPSITKDGINSGGKQITNIKDGITADSNGKYTVTDQNKGNAANINDVQNIVNDAKKDLTDGANGLNNKANVDASNIGENLKDAKGNKALTDEITKNKNAWASAIGTDKVEKGNKQLVTSDAVAQALDGKADKSYVDQELNKKADKSYVDEKLDTKANKSDVYTKDETYSKTEVDSKVTDITKGLDGKAGKDLDNISNQGKTVIHNIAKDAVEVVAGTNTKVTKTEGTDTTSTKYAVNVEGNGKVESGNKGLISGGTLYNEVHVEKDGSYIKSGNTVGQNLSSLDTGLKTTSDLIHTNTAGDTIQIGGNSTATKIDVSGKDANGNTKGRVITGVISDASDPNSAANVGYVNGLTAANTQQIYRDMNNAYSRLDTNINRAAAGSNALAALHPLEFDPADKASFAVGYGHYHNANAAAVGAFYQPNANTMVNMGISLGNGDPGFNAGVSFKLGQGSVYNGVSKAEMAQTIQKQSEQINALEKANQKTEKENEEMKAQIKQILERLNG